MENLETLTQTVLNTPAQQWLDIALKLAPGAIGGLALVAAVLFAKQVALLRLQKYLQTHKNPRTSILWGTRLLEALQAWFIVLAGLDAAVQGMPYMDAVDGPVRRLFMLAVFLQIGLMAVHLLGQWKHDYHQQYRSKDPARVAMMGNMVRIGYVCVWVVVFIALLNSYGVDVTAMVAGLGVGGIAVAFALQNVLKDIFSSFSIVFDKPFVIGDFIIAGDYMGTVEDIGIKTTRIRSISGEQIVMSNSDLLEARIRNYRTLGERRVVFTIKVDYATPADKLAAIPQTIVQLLAKNKDVRMDRCHLQSLTDFGPQYETVFFVAVPDYTRMMDILQDVYLGLFKAFQKDGIRFAIPVQKNIGEDTHHQPKKPLKPNAKPLKRKKSNK